ncbi:PurS Phosphoribosylformylglycinamidine (FGAM) synthase, PurS component [Fimbriimonadaceae bacterium]
MARISQTIDVARAQILVTLKPSLLDSAGRTVAGSLQNLGFTEVSEVRVGKLIEIELAEYSEARVKEMCEKLLANPVIERFEIKEIV